MPTELDTCIFLIYYLFAIILFQLVKLSIIAIELIHSVYYYTLRVIFKVLLYFTAYSLFLRETLLKKNYE